VIRAVSLLLFGSALVFGQIQYLIVDGPGSEKPVSALYQLGSAPIGDRLDATFRIRNTTQAQLVIRTLTIAGAAFSISGQPALPHTLAPGLNMDFTVRFAPKDLGSYSANLSVNGVSLLLTGSSAAAPVLSIGGVQLPSGSAIDLVLTERGTAISKSFHLENITSERVRVQSAAVAGKQFRLKDDLLLPIELAPRASMDFEVVFAASTSGVFEGSLVIDGRTFRLTGSANEPPFPKPTIIVDLPNSSSGQQGRVSVQFGQPSRAIGAGKLRMEFRPAIAGTPDDEAVRFMRGNRLNSFDVAEGVQIPISDLTFQTGSTAGTIMFIAEVGGWTASANIEIVPERIHVEKVRAARNTSMVEMEITGYDNTRTVNQLAFTFYGANGEVIQPGAIRVDSTADFSRYFVSSTLGGSFTLKAVFPVAGAIANIASVQVELVNSSGVARTEKIQIQ